MNFGFSNLNPGNEEPEDLMSSQFILAVEFCADMGSTLRYRLYLGKFDIAYPGGIEEFIGAAKQTGE